MSVYKLVPDGDSYDSLLYDEQDDTVSIDRQFNGQPLARSWIPVRVKIYSVGQRGDFPELGSHIPVFSERAWRILEPLIGASVEALPLACDEGTFLAINVTDVADCLDHERSSISRFSDGRVMWVDSHVFKEGCVGDRNIFKIPESRLAAVFVSEKFKKAVEDTGLEGLIFRQVA
jgi:hypothetical protein